MTKKQELSRYRFAIHAASIHLMCSVLVASLAAWVVFAVWYVYPYRELSGGRELFWLLVSVDVVCGPLLTFVLCNPKKARRELLFDLSLVALIQFGALGYGMWAVWQARPLYLVLEVDRYKVISAPDLERADLEKLPVKLRPQFWASPQIVGIRPPKNVEEHNQVLLEAAAGGRDYGARPEFYISYDDEVALKALNKAKPLSVFLQRYPALQVDAQELAVKRGGDLNRWLFLPIIARQDWIAIIDENGQIQGYLPGDGFF